jgi:peptidoglycan-N-acetylglucosamine deacetylase
LSDLPRFTIALTFDPDVISDAILLDAPLAKFHHGEFAVRVGIPRILELLAREAIPTTWFVPVHTLRAFPAAVDAIRAGDHEIAAHGIYHEDMATLTTYEQKSILSEARQAIEEITGASPLGIRNPYWSVGFETLQLIEEQQFLYDSSLMAGDFHPYRVRHGDRHDRVKGTMWGTLGSLIEVPVSATLNDWYHFEQGPSRDGLSAPSKVLEIWTEELRYGWEHEPGGVLTLTMHPECIGRGHRMAMLERFIATAKELEGLAFNRLDRYVLQRRESESTGFRIPNA